MNNFERFDSVEGKVVCNIAKGCFVESDCGEFYLPRYNFPQETRIFGTVIFVPEEIGKLPVIALDSVVYHSVA